MQVNRFLFLIIFLAFKAGAQTSALSIADSLYAVGDYREAVQALEHISQKSDAVHLKLAKSHEAGGNYKAALVHYALVVERDPQKILAALSYGKLLKKAGQLQKADTVFLQLTEKYPKNASFQYQRGLIKEQQKDSTTMSFFMRATMLDKTHQAAHFKLAKDFLSKAKFSSAEYMSRRGLESNPNYVSLISILAQALYHQEKYAEAIEHFERLVELGEGSEFVHSRLGQAWTKGRNYDKAIEEYQRALDFEDKNFVTHHRLGKLYALTEDYEKSEMHLLMSIILKDVSLDEEYYSLAMTYRLSKDFKKALEYFDKALQENPDNEQALYERAIAADSYFADLETRLNYYQAYLNKYEESGNKKLVRLADRRVKDIREEMHLTAQ